jgi:hypothetical protein
MVVSPNTAGEYQFVLTRRVVAVFPVERSVGESEPVVWSDEREKGDAG